MKSAAIVICAALFAAAVPTPSVAEKVSNSTAASLLTHCLLEDDATDTMGPGLDAPNTDTCCSKSLGYCVECPSDGSGQCEKFPVRGRLGPLGTKTTAPNSGVVAPTTTIRDHRTAPAGSIVAPVK